MRKSTIPAKKSVLDAASAVGLIAALERNDCFGSRLDRQGGGWIG
jgi:hypothetical protein